MPTLSLAHPSEPADAIVPSGLDGQDSLVQLLGVFDQHDDLLVYTKDAEARWTACNDAALRVFNLPGRPSIIGRCDIDLHSGDIGERIWSDDCRILRSGEPLRNHNETVMPRNGTPLVVQTTKIPLRDGNDAIVGLAGLTRIKHALSVERRYPARVERVLAFIEANLAQPLETAGLADIACVSESQLRRLFKRHLSLTPHDYVGQERLRRAASLLRDSEEPIARIAHAVGFYDQSHLTASFSRWFGISPARFRERTGISQSAGGRNRRGRGSAAPVATDRCSAEERLPTPEPRLDPLSALVD